MGVGRLRGCDGIDWVVESVFESLEWLMAAVVGVRMSR